MDRSRGQASVVPLADRATAGRLLAAKLGERGFGADCIGSERIGAERIGAERIGTERTGTDRIGTECIVLAIPRGGVPVAAALSAELGIPFDVLVAHKLGAPGNPELAIGAVAADGTTLIEPWAGEAVGADESYLRRAAAQEIERVRRHEAALRGGRPPLALAGRTAILVDDGIATGATMHAAVLAARAAGARRIVCAIPVGAAESVAALARVADEVVALATPAPFHAVGDWYVRFDQVADADVARLLAAGRDGTMRE